MVKIFRDRVEAGQLLAQKLFYFSEQKNTLILALPRGGVPVAYQVAQTLKLPLDVFLVRKLGVPIHEELAFGAIAMEGTTVFNEEIIRDLGLDNETIAAVIAKETEVLNERNRKYRGNRPFPKVKGQTVIVVDDGIATGATMRAAVKALRKMGCAAIVVASPIAPPEIYAQFENLADQVICVETPSAFFAIGSWYENFPQTTDEEVYQLINAQ